MSAVARALERLGGHLPREGVLTRHPWLLAAFMIPGTAAYFGVQFDVAWHIDRGRDHFDIPPHLVMIAGMQLGGLAMTAMLLAIAAIAAKGGRVHLPLARLREIPYSPLLAIALACFVAPGVVIGLDEIWHRIFGLDVTAWSPTHLTALYTAAFAGLAMAAVLAAELNRVLPRRSAPGLRRLRDLHPSEGWLIYSICLFGAGLLVLLIEYDFDVPQFNLAFQPPLLAALTAFPVFAGMAALGVRFGASVIGAAIVCVKVLVLLSLIVLGRTHPDVPASILAAALAVDVVVLSAGDRPRQRALLAALAVYPAVLIGSEWLRLELLGQPQWTDGLWPYGAPLAIPAGMVAGALGLRAGWALRPVARPLAAPAPGASRSLARRLVPAGLAVVMLLGPAAPAALAHGGYTREIVLSRLSISPARPGPGDEVRVRLTVGQRSIDGHAPPFIDAPERELGAFRAGARLREPLRRTGPRTFEGTLRLDSPGRWVIWPKFKLPGERWIDRTHFTVEPGAPPGGIRSFLTEIGPEADPDEAPGWLKPVGFAIMLGIWTAVTLAVAYSLRLVARFGFGGEAAT